MLKGGRGGHNFKRENFLVFELDGKSAGKTPALQILNSGGLEEIDTLFAGPSVVIIFGGAVGQTDGFVEGTLGEDAVDARQTGKRIPVNI